MIDFYSVPLSGFEGLKELVRILRAPDGCPWDSVQTHESIRRNFIEEVYEACEAIDQGNTDLLREELGDVLLHVVFHASIEEDAGHFTVEDVCDTVVRKMVSRHPKLFGQDEGLSWDELKRREKGISTLDQELDSVARSLPSLWRAEKLQGKAEKAGFPQNAPERELLASAEQLAEHPEDSEALGRLLFAAVALGRKTGTDPEAALHSQCEAYIASFRQEEQTNQNQQNMIEKSKEL